MRRKGYVEHYTEADLNNRIHFLFSHNREAKKLLAGYQEELVLYLSNQMVAYGRREKEGLGVRVQEWGTISDPTARLAMLEMEMQTYVEKGQLPAQILRKLPDIEFIEKRMFDLVIMKNEFSLFASVAGRLKKEDRSFLELYERTGKDLYKVAEELQIAPESAERRLYRVKKHIAERMKPYMYGACNRAG